MATVKVEIVGGHTLTSSLTRESADELGLEPGTDVTVATPHGATPVVDDISLTVTGSGGDTRSHEG